MKRILSILIAILFLISCKKTIIPTPIPTPTLTLATVSTTSIDGITQINAQSGGSITSDGNSVITARGVCWSISANPTITNSKTADGTGSGVFTSILTGLAPNTIYNIRAYATNTTGTAYGNNVTFPTLPEIVTDIDGNIYNTVTIGTQVWMKENLKTSRYRNGDVIPTGLNNAAWFGTTSGAYSIYNHNAANNTTYGKLYNWYAVTDPRNICPAGWHIPTEAEWTTLRNYLGGDTVAGGKMKATILWISPNTATNESGFTALPGGYRYNGGNFANIGYMGVWWSSNVPIAGMAFCHYVDQSGILNKYGGPKEDGLSVRCIKD